MTLLKQPKMHQYFRHYAKLSVREMFQYNPYQELAN